MPAVLCQVLGWAQQVTGPNPEISVSPGAAGVRRKTGLRWLHLPPTSRNRQERSWKGWGHRPGESGGCGNSYIVKAGMRKLKVSSVAGGGAGNTKLKEAPSWSPHLLVAPRGKAAGEITSFDIQSWSFPYCCFQPDCTPSFQMGISLSLAMPVGANFICPFEQLILLQ